MRAFLIFRRNKTLKNNISLVATVIASFKLLIHLWKFRFSELKRKVYLVG